MAMHSLPDRRNSLVLLLALLASPGRAQQRPDLAPYFHKLQSHKILELATAHTAQDLLVEFEDDGLELSITSRRVQTEEAANRRLEFASRWEVLHILEQLKKDRLVIVKELQEKLSAIKADVLSTKPLARARLVRDYPSSPLVLVSIPDLETLGALLKNARVRRTHQNLPIRVI